MSNSNIQKLGLQKLRLVAGVSGMAICIATTSLAQGLGEEGFAIVIDGEQTAGDASFDETIYNQAISKAVSSQYQTQETVAMDNARINVRFDGFDTKPALDFSVEKTDRGTKVTTYSNYPAFQERGAIIAYRNDNGQLHQVASASVEPNGSVIANLPTGENISYVYRVYDRNGRYDQTTSKTLGAGRYDLSGGASSLERQNIPVFGGAVVVNAEDAMPGASVKTLGEELSIPEGGELVVERILPPGEYSVAVNYQSQSNKAVVERRINIADEDWFYIGIAEVTVGQYLEDTDDVAKGDIYDSGRAAFFARGRVKGDYLITMAADTGEGEIGTLFDGFDAKDAKSIIDRIDPDEYYTVYGDNSQIEDYAPTSGKFYVRVDRGNDYALWGDFKANINGADYVRSDRKLYGASAHAEVGVNSAGQPGLELDAYAAQPARLARRDAFLGTGGSVYFLREQDVSAASETLNVEYRDEDTGRVIERRELVAGRDYEINYTQGLITLNEPLSSSGPDTIAGDKSEAVLVAQYEYTPLATEYGDLSFGGRVEANPNKNVTVGAAYISEDQGINKQELVGADVTIRAGENTYVRAEYAESKGAGFGYALSEDGGLSIDQISDDDNTREGSATKVELHADLSDFNDQVKGWVDAYYETRADGFTNQDYITKGDTELYGGKLTVKPNDDSELNVYAEHKENPLEGDLDKQGVGIAAQVSPVVSGEFSINQEKISNDPSGNDGARTQARGKIAFQVGADSQVYAVGEATLESEGSLAKNDRYGAGFIHEINDFWRVGGEVTDGTLGLGAEVTANYEDGRGNQSYIGYRLDPERSIDDASISGTDYGQVVIGSRNRVSDDLSTFAETRYDMFGAHRSLGQAYGLDYAYGTNWNFDGAFENSQVIDTGAGDDFERNAISIGVKYNWEEKTAFSIRGEYREDSGTLNGTLRDEKSTLVSMKARDEYDPTITTFGSLSWMRVWDSPLAESDGDYIDARLGYAYRPIDNDRWNTLLDYRYVQDDLGQVIDGDAQGVYNGMHIFSTDTRFDVNGLWEIGGKVAYRDAFGKDEAGSITHNRAFMMAPSVRYKVTHEWDVSAAYRMMYHQDAQLWDQSGTLAVYRHIGDHMQMGVGYNMGSFTDDLTELNATSSSAFINITADF